LVVDVEHQRIWSEAKLDPLVALGRVRRPVGTGKAPKQVVETVILFNEENHMLDWAAADAVTFATPICHARPLGDVDGLTFVPHMSERSERAGIHERDTPSSCKYSDQTEKSHPSRRDHHEPQVHLPGTGIIAARLAPLKARPDPIRDPFADSCPSTLLYVAFFQW
jgi:hypothetical protein